MAPARGQVVRAVVDTNVLVSGLISEVGAPARIAEAIRAREFQLVVSPVLLDELLDVLMRPRIRLLTGHDAVAVARQVATLRRYAHLVGGEYLDIEMVATDPKDNPVIGCALEGDASYLVTADKRDLLALKDHHVAGHRIVHVVTAGDFVRHVLLGDSRG